MKLRRVRVQMTRERGGSYDRYDVTLPADAIRDLKWTPGVDLEWEIEGDSIKLRPAKKSRK
jgi:antitoxin component of MazEF toxin-antitoxin module